MPPERLAIPLDTNPARQNAWRAVRLLSLILGAVVLGFFLERAMHFRTTRERWPVDATIQVRLIKTPSAYRHVTTNLAGTQALPGGPWGIEEALTWAEREFILYSSGDDIVGLSVDGTIPEQTRIGMDDWGWQTLQTGKKTLIYRKEALPPLEPRRLLNAFLTIPTFDGAITLKEGEHFRTVPYRFTEKSIVFPMDMRAFVPEASLTFGPNTTLLASFTLPPTFADALVPASLPATLPGLRELRTAIDTAGATLVLGQDQEGLALSLSTNSGNMSAEELGAIAHEGMSLRNLSTSALTLDDISVAQEIRATSEINVQINSSDDIASAVAKDEFGRIFRLTQSPTQLIVSNRAPFIGVDFAPASTTCMKNPLGFIRPADLREAAQLGPTTTNPGLYGRLQAAEEIAFRKNRLKICW